jgi:hypothetical protein
MGQRSPVTRVMNRYSEAIKPYVRQFGVSGGDKGVTFVAAQPVPLIPAPTQTTAHTGRDLRLA